MYCCFKIFTTDCYWEEAINKIYAYLVLLSFIGLIGYLRFFQNTRILTYFMKESIIQMIPFMLVVAILILAFTMSYAVARGQNEV
jgi:ABC-type uncharacterized transport system permease subunit